MHVGGVLCQNRPTPGNDCTTANAVPDISTTIRGTITSIVTFVSTRLAQSTNGEQDKIGRRETGYIQTANRYINARLANEHKQILNLITSDIRLTSSRDGQYRGRDEFLRYLSKVPPTGKWSKATWNVHTKQAEVRGIVRVVFVNINVIARFGFDNRGKIRDIYVGTKRNK